MSIIYHQQDLVPLLEARNFQVFAHGCNCFNCMGGGIAREVARIFPKVENADQKSLKGDLNKLGTIQAIKVPPYSSPHIVINAYTQFQYWGKGANVDYTAIESCFAAINKYMIRNEYTELVIPKIGAGLARGEWSIIEKLVDKCFSDSIQVDVYYL